MGEFLARLFSSDFMPHGHCYLWRPEILWLHVFSDSVITAAYYFIPLALVYFVAQAERSTLSTGCFSCLGFSFLRAAQLTSWKSGPSGTAPIGSRE